MYVAWPFKEAAQIVKHRKLRDDRPVLFETGFGPSGLPHIGTFAEVARTTWVRNAFEEMTGSETRLMTFSDDMDGLRKVPLNFPEEKMLTEHLGRPLCTIPDPFGESSCFSDYMNQKLKIFLDTYEFDYDFQSSSASYLGGDFNEGLSILLEKVQDVRSIVAPTLGEDKRESWSPFLPICPSCGSVYATRVTEYFPAREEIGFVCDGSIGNVVGCGTQGEVSILSGKVKVGWKMDWALRWYTYEVDYEMYGKDLIESAKLSGRIVRLMGKHPPVGMNYELFLDEDGKKISKSVGRGLTVDTWVEYAPIESLLYYIFQNPRRARRLYWDVVPKCVDDYLEALRKYPTIESEKLPEQVLWHIFGRGNSIHSYGAQVNFSMVGNLISALGANSPDLLVDYLNRYDEKSGDYPEVIEALIQKGMNYYRDFVLPNKQYRTPTAREADLLRQLSFKLEGADLLEEAELQAIPFEIARETNTDPKSFFQMFYEIVLGQERGPRFGSFAKMVGLEQVRQMIHERIV